MEVGGQFDGCFLSLAVNLMVVGQQVGGCLSLFMWLLVFNFVVDRQSLIW